MADIFISYASEDQAVAAQLARAIESLGWTVWWDRRLRSGTDFAKEIGDQLECSRCVIVLWSGSSIASHWVRDEASEGLRRQLLVPVVVEAVQPPYGFRSIQAANLVGWKGDLAAPAFECIVSDLGSLLGAPTRAAASAAPPTVKAAPKPAPPPPLESSPAPSAAPAAGTRVRWALGLGLALVGGGAYLLGSRGAQAPAAPDIARTDLAARAASEAENARVAAAATSAAEAARRAPAQQSRPEERRQAGAKVAADRAATPITKLTMSATDVAPPRDAAAPKAGPPPPASQAAPTTSPKPAQAAPTRITFVNQTRDAVEVYWINFQDQKQRYARLAPGESYEQPTYVSHRWVVLDAGSQEELARTVGTAEPTTLRVVRQPVGLVR